MTETNINALCSVEAVFDGVDIEVTVEFSAGGGTFEHDELTAESREKANQHPIPSITGLQSALDGKANSSHVHNISDVTGLQSALDGKSSVVEHNDLTGRDAADVHPKESITGLKIADSPEFADTQITSLAVKATYTPTVWSYLVGLFTTVPKSVKEHIVKEWTVIENLKSRITAIETKIIADVTVSQEVSAVDITGLNIKEGETVAVQFHGEQFIIPPNTSAYMYIRVNGISDALYNNGATTGGIPNYAWFRVTFRERTSLQLFFTLFNGKVLMSGEAMTIGGATSYPYIISGILLSSITAISSINFSSSSIGSYKAGDNFRVVKL